MPEQTDTDRITLTIKLMSSINLDEVSVSVFDTINQAFGSSAGIAILLWDQDLESFGDRYYSGTKEPEIRQLCDEFVDDFDEDGKILSQATFKSPAANGLTPAYAYQVKHEGQLCACILIFGPDDDLKPAELFSFFESYPFAIALRNAWEYRELQRENERLRTRKGEETGDIPAHTVQLMAEQTAKLIDDLTHRDTARTRQLERERLVYWISNAVRSSVQISTVLATIVEKIGTTFGVSRCLFLRVVDSEGQAEVVEFTQRQNPSVRDRFLDGKGLAFTRLALTHTSPQLLLDPELDEQCPYDREFLRELGMRSGLIVPLIMRERILAVLFLQDCVGRRAWSIDDTSLLSALADNLSVAIENAELH